MTGYHSLQFRMEILNWTIAGPLALQILDWKDTQHLIKCSTVTLMLLAHTQRKVRKTWRDPWPIHSLFLPGSSCPDLVFSKFNLLYLPDLKWNKGTYGRQEVLEVVADFALMLAKCGKTNHAMTDGPFAQAIQKWPFHLMSFSEQSVVFMVY